MSSISVRPSFYEGVKRRAKTGKTTVSALVTRCILWGLDNPAEEPDTRLVEKWVQHNARADGRPIGEVLDQLLTRVLDRGN